jgi:sulfate adenylyltransferase subunit 1 (EFTu-like GTPase family)
MKKKTLLGKTISKKDADKDLFEDVTNYKIKRMYSEEEVHFFVKNILYHIKYYEYNVNNLELISFSNDIESEIEKLYEEFKNKLDMKKEKKRIY